MKHRFAVLDVLTVVITALILAGAVWIAVRGPTGPLPMHFDINGRADRWGDRQELAGLIGFLGLMVAVVGGGMGIYAARSDDPARGRGLRVGQLLTLIVLGTLAPVVSLQILWAAGQTGAVTFGGAVWPMALTGLVSVVIGTFLGRVPPNVAVGVRTPWSLKSRLAWDRSNRLMGRLLFWSGLATLIAAPVAPQPIGFWIALAALLLSGLAAGFESWRVWRADPERQPF
jgi:uncharacterized membrane protein